MYISSIKILRALLHSFMYVIYETSQTKALTEKIDETIQYFKILAQQYCSAGKVDFPSRSMI